METASVSRKWQPRHSFVALSTSTAGRSPMQWVSALQNELTSLYGALHGGAPLDLVHWGEEQWAAGPAGGAPVVIRVPTEDVGHVLCACALLAPPARVLAATSSLQSAMAALPLA